MKGVIFYAESQQESWSGDIARWTNALEKFGVDYYIVIDNHNIIPSWQETKNITGHRVATFEEALAKLQSEYPDAKTVYMTTNATTELKDLTMPDNPCFVVGPDTGSIPVFTPDYEVKVFAINIWAIDCIDLAIYEAYRQGK